MGNKHLTKSLMVYTKMVDMGRPPKPEHLRHSKMLTMKLTTGYWNWLEGSARKLGISAAELFREGAKFYVHQEGKDGSRNRTEKLKR